MLKIRIPQSFENERRYIIDLFFHELLGLKYDLIVYDERDYEIELPNAAILIIKDHFFSDISADNYLDLRYFPNAPFFVRSSFCDSEEMPVFYGNPTVQVDENKIICSADIFASAFFMLTRWEEYVNPVRDKYDRFPGKESYLQTHKLHYRPLVNEYEAFLWKILVHLGLDAQRKQRQFKLIPTHDVDNFARYDQLKKVFRALGGDLIKRKSISQFFKTINTSIAVCRGKRKDPYDMFDELMDMSENAGVKSEFYFIPGVLGETDVRYQFLSEPVRQTIEKIESRGHIVGYHAGMDSFKNPKQFTVEINRIRSVAKRVISGRQHYLRFAVPFTWRLWSENGFKYDSSICYENDIGFRAGIACEYPVFDILERKQLALIERPTIVMERAVLLLYPDPVDFLKTSLKIRKQVEKHHGQFVFLWHPDNFNVSEWTDYKAFYVKLLSK
jgi:peptidoglycan/xylan/chitin deacetylase (PgdA/CDA1 family)